MRLVWLIAVLAVLYFGNQYWQRHVEQAKSGGAPNPATVSGGPVRDWQQAPNALMGMQDAMGGAGRSRSKGMQDTVRQGLDR